MKKKKYPAYYLLSDIKRPEVTSFYLKVYLNIKYFCFNAANELLFVSEGHEVKVVISNVS